MHTDSNIKTGTNERVNNDRTPVLYVKYRSYDICSFIIYVLFLKKNENLKISKKRKW